MARGKHRQSSALRRGLLAAGAGAAVLALTGGVAVASTPDQTASCAEAQRQYTEAFAHEQDTAKAENTARDADTDARLKANTAAEDAQAAYEDWLKTHPEVKDDPATKPDEHAQWEADRAAAQAKRDATIAEAHKDYKAGGTAARYEAAQKAEHAAVLDRDAKQATADNACKGQPGEPGKDGGIVASVILRPNVCARAVIKPDTREVLRVIAYIPCPQPAPGTSTTTTQDAQPPTPVEAHLPVTH